MKCQLACFAFICHSNQKISFHLLGKIKIMDPIYNEMSEYIILEESPVETVLQEPGQEFGVNEVFNRARTLYLISLYKKYKARVGTYDVRNMKKLWEVIAYELSVKFNIAISASKCENKFKVLERNYKKVQDNNNKTGRSRRIFEFEEEFNEIYGKKKNIHPKLLLSATTVDDTMKENSGNATNKTEDLHQPPIPKASEGHALGSPIAQSGRSSNVGSCAHTTSRRKSSYKNINTLFAEIQKDINRYYESKQKNDTEKLNIAERKQEIEDKKLNVFKEYVEEIKKLNEFHTNHDLCGTCKKTKLPFM